MTVRSYKHVVPDITGDKMVFCLFFVVKFSLSLSVMCASVYVCVFTRVSVCVRLCMCAYLHVSVCVCV